jgi:hypothetical protein
MLPVVRPLSQQRKNRSSKTHEEKKKLKNPEKTKNLKLRKNKKCENIKSRFSFICSFGFEFSLFTFTPCSWLQGGGVAKTPSKFTQILKYINKILKILHPRGRPP